jgi:hypothetical protein
LGQRLFPKSRRIDVAIEVCTTEGIVDEDIDAASSLEDLVHHLLCLGIVVVITNHGRARSAKFAEAGDFGSRRV